jgi:hypothetical protein
MTHHPRKKISISILIPFLVIMLFFTVMFWQKYRSSHEIPIVPPASSTEGSRSVILFFVDEEARLTREARDIDACDDDSACLKSVLDELLNGPVGEFDEAVPSGTTVDSVRIEGNLATIELNSLFSDSMLSGSAAEILAVYSVVNTTTVNFPLIQKVKINIDGNPGAVLRHLDLSDPFMPDYSLEQSNTPVPENKSTGAPAKRKE